MPEPLCSICGEPITMHGEADCPRSYLALKDSILDRHINWSCLITWVALLAWLGLIACVAIHALIAVWRLLP